MIRLNQLRLLTLLVTIAAALLLASPSASTEAGETSDLLLILDASGSMWGQIDGENKIVIARRVMAGLIEGLPDESEVGLVAYGHRREGDCEDIETVVPIGPLDRGALTGRIGELNPKGKTPITRSVEEAFASVRGREEPTTIVLVSDGLETCGGDPCATVRAAAEEGIDFVLHVVGFDVAKEDVSSLECAAQAGNGLYLTAETAGELGAALDRAVAMPAEVPGGRLSVKVIADGELADAAVHVTRSADGEEAGGGRTYTSPETNPRIIPLADGTYDVEVTAVGLRGDNQRTFAEVVIAEDGEMVEKVVDFTAGEVTIEVTRNGELSDATVRAYRSGTTEQVDASRSYAASSSNPVRFRLTAGTYDVEIGSVEMSDKPEHRWEGVVIEPGGLAELSHDFTSGTLKVGATLAGELVDATTSVRRVSDGKAVAQGRTYTSPKSNPKTWDLAPGRYRVTVKGVRLEGDPRREVELEVRAGEITETMVEFDG